MCIENGVNAISKVEKIKLSLSHPLHRQNSKEIDPGHREASRWWEQSCVPLCSHTCCVSGSTFFGDTSKWLPDCSSTGWAWSLPENVDVYPPPQWLQPPTSPRLLKLCKQKPVTMLLVKVKGNDSKGPSVTWTERRAAGPQDPGARGGTLRFDTGIWTPYSTFSVLHPISLAVPAVQ